MLTKADVTSKDLIIDFCKDSLLGTRISCYVLAYGFELRFVDFYLYFDEAELKGVITKFEDNITVLLNDNNNTDELCEFINMLGCSSVTCNYPLFDNSDVIIKKGYVISKTYDDFSAENVKEQDYRSMYELISENIPNSFLSTKEAYLSFLSDFTFRRTRGLSRAKGVYIGDTLAACGVTSAECESSALLSGIACNKNLRKSGLGKTVVLSLSNELIKENKNVYVIALNSSAEGFYEHIGFKECEKIYIYERTLK